MSPDKQSRPGTSPGKPIVSPRSLQRAPKGPAEARTRKPSRRRAKIGRAFPLNIGLVSSLAIHAAIILLAWSTWTIGRQVIERVQEQAIIPDATIIQGAEVGGIPNPGLGGDPTRKAASADPNQSFASSAWAARPSRELQATVMGATSDVTDSMIGVGSRITSDGGSAARAAAAGAGTAMAAPFGVPGGGAGLVPKSTFMGVSGNARKIVFVCDGSGSMTGMRIVQLNAELERSVAALKPIQGFNVIFFSEQPAQMLSDVLIAANDSGRQRLHAFLQSVQLQSGSDPVPSLRLAFAQQPDLIYLLTDGDFTNTELGEGMAANRRVVAELERMNADKHVKINTIAFGSPDATAQDAQAEYTRTLRMIAEQSGGTFAFVAQEKPRVE